MVLTYFLSMADGWCTEPEAAGAFNSLSPPPLLQPLRPRGFLKLNKNHSRQQPKTAVCLLHNCSAAVQTYKLWLLHTEYVEHPPTPPPPLLPQRWRNVNPFPHDTFTLGSALVGAADLLFAQWSRIGVWRENVFARSPFEL